MSSSVQKFYDEQWNEEERFSNRLTKEEVRIIIDKCIFATEDYELIQQLSEIKRQWR